MKKKLFFAAVDLNIGGIEKALVNLLNVIDYSKYDVVLFLEKKEGTLLNELNKNVVVKELKVSKLKITPLRKIVNFTRKLIFKLKNKNKYDFSCCYATYSYSAAKISLMASTNSSLYVHSDYSFIYNEKDFREFFDSRYIDLFRRIVFVSNESRNNFLKYYPNLNNKTLVFNNFINIKDILEKSKEKIPLELNDKNKHLVFIGRLEDKSKKVGRCINLINNIEDTDLMIIGDGPDRREYEKLVYKYDLNDRIKFLGMKDNPYPYIKNADYLILTSDYEGFPVIYLEAIALKKTIITTINTSDETINIKDGFGYIISKDNDKMISEVKTIISNKNKLKSIDLDVIQKNRIKMLEQLFEGVI